MIISNMLILLTSSLIQVAEPMKRSIVPTSALSFFFLLFFSFTLIGQDNFLQFASGSDHVVVPHDEALDLSTFTIEAWINPCEIANFDVIAAKATDNSWSQGFVLYLNGSNGLSLSVNWANVASSSSTMNLGSWYHVAGTYDGSTGKVFINGVEEGSISYSNYVPEDGTLTLGLDGSFYPYDGSMAEVRLWNIARTASDIQSTMSTRLSGDEANLVAYYPLNQGSCGNANDSESNATDASSNGLNGTLTGFALEGTESNWICASANNTRCTLAELPVSSLTTCAAQGGTLTSNGATELSVCLDDDVNVPVDLSGANGNAFWVFMNEDGTFTGGSPGSIQDAINLSNFGNNNVARLAVISYLDGFPSGYESGASPDDLEGCFGISNTLIINTSRNNMGLCCEAEVMSLTIGGSGETAATVTVGDGQSDAFTLNAQSTGANSTFIVADANGNITAVTEDPDFDFESDEAGIVYLYQLVFDGIMNFGPAVGRNLSQLVGSCFDLSDPVIVTKQADTGGSTVNDIPTMGEWLLIIMLLLFFIVGTIAMRQFVFAN